MPRLALISGVRWEYFRDERAPKRFARSGLHGQGSWAARAPRSADPENPRPLRGGYFVFALNGSGINRRHASGQPTPSSLKMTRFSFAGTPIDSNIPVSSNEWRSLDSRKVRAAKFTEVRLVWLNALEKNMSGARRLAAGYSGLASGWAHHRFRLACLAFSNCARLPCRIALQSSGFCSGHNARCVSWRAPLVVRAPTRPSCHRARTLADRCSGSRDPIRTLVPSVPNSRIL